MDRVFSEHSEPVKRELRAYIEDWEKLSMKKDDQRYRTRFLAKYGGLYLYDGKAKKLVMATVICGIKNIHFLSPMFLVLLHVESHKRFLVLVQ